MLAGNVSANAFPEDVTYMTRDAPTHAHYKNDFVEAPITFQPGRLACTTSNNDLLFKRF
jgi:hypothetical protein